MGAAFNDTIVFGTRDTIQKKFAAIQDRDLYENGHSYSGGFGMAHGLRFTTETFDSEDVAREWLLEHAQKWDAALAVRIRPDADDKWMIGAWCSS